jgi:hypothetical protein
VIHNMPKKVFICYYNYDKIKNTCQWLLTTDEVFANQSDQEYELASLDDLHDWVAATDQVFDNCIITVVEGKCKWIEEDYVDFVGNICWKCEYEIIWE